VGVDELGDFEGTSDGFDVGEFVGLLVGEKV